MSQEEIDENEKIKENNTITIISKKEEEIVLSPDMMISVKESLLSYCKTDKKFIQEILMNALSDSNVDEVTQLRTLTKKEAKEEIIKFIKLNPGAKTSDIIFTLGIDPIVTVDLLKELKNEEKVGSEKIDG